MATSTTATDLQPRDVPEPRKDDFDVQQIRRAIPTPCFQASNTTSFLYVIRDVTAVCLISYAISLVPAIAFAPARWVLLTALSFIQGLFFTGIWIIAHECGHEALYRSRWLNDTVGFVLHSFLLVPFFSWKYTHARHHRYTNHMEKDTAFVPSTSSEGVWRSKLRVMLGSAEDSPLQNMIMLLGHQLLGWPMYLLSYVSAGPKSRAGSKDKPLKSHFDPQSGIFSVKEEPFILLSDLGLGLVLFFLWTAAKHVGFTTVAMAYVVPYLWVNHWIVAITYLHHTHHSVHHFTPETWNYTNGALSTVDRDFGFIGRHIFHGIIEFHVVHHLFPRIPFYHAEEATQAIKLVLGEKYISDSRPFLPSLWRTFTSCKFVEEKTAPGILEWVK